MEGQHFVFEPRHRTRP